MPVLPASRGGFVASNWSLTCCQVRGFCVNAPTGAVPAIAATIHTHRVRRCIGPPAWHSSSQIYPLPAASSAYLLAQVSLSFGRGLGPRRRLTLESSRGTVEWHSVAWKEPREWRLRAF